MQIDAHQHFWHYDPREYGWIESDRLRRDFLPQHLEEEIASAGINGVISVQARQTEEETNWLLSLAGRHSFIFGVVGWVPLAADDVQDRLSRLASDPKLRGVRHVLQSEPDENYMLRDDFNRGISHLAQLNLRYDILVFERHLPQVIRLVDKHPRQIFILDHIAKPRIRDDEIEPWATNIREVARRENVYCKVSGMATEADPQRWSAEQLRRYWDVVLEAFGPERLMFGSDWPVCLSHVTYPQWRQIVADWTARLSPVYVRMMVVLC